MSDGFQSCTKRKSLLLLFGTRIYFLNGVDIHYPYLVTHVFSHKQASSQHQPWTESWEPTSPAVSTGDTTTLRIQQSTTTTRSTAGPISTIPNVERATLAKNAGNLHRRLTKRPRIQSLSTAQIRPKAKVFRIIGGQELSPEWLRSTRVKCYDCGTNHTHGLNYRALRMFPC